MIPLLSQEDAARIRRTDKANLIRAAFYKEFAPLIDAVYAEPPTSSTLRVLDEGELRFFLRNEVAVVLQPDRKDIVQDDVDRIFARDRFFTSC